MLRLFAIAAGVVALAGSAAAAAPTVKVETGALSGSTADGIVSFKDIPFTAPPVGALRWKPPAPAARWTGVRDATAYGASCPQPLRGAGEGGGVPNRQSEDCLNLNVWAPANARSAPVMVWIHGGAHRVGSGTYPLYDGTPFAKAGIVLVTINYRIGLLGYFAHPALTAEASATTPLGNFGLMDQLAALQWVQRNIKAFGGDPSNVTVFGESAGGASTIFLLANPAAKGLFAKAIVESGGGLQRSPDLKAKEAEGAKSMTAMGLPATASAADLRALTPEQILAGSGPLSGGGLGFGPFVDGRLVTEAPWRAFAEGRAIDVPMIVGANSNEASVLTTLGVPKGLLPALAGPRLAELKAAYGDVSDEEFTRQAMGDAVFVAPARWIAARSATGKPAWLYQFAYVISARRGASPGAGHGAEIPFVFQTWDRLPTARIVTDEDRAMTALVSSCWISFAKTGAPNCAGGQAWPAYDPATDQTLVFGTETKVVPGFKAKQFDIFTERFMATTGR